MPMPTMTLAHGIPFWFLVLSLFLPRLSLFIGWIHMWWFFIPQPWAAVVWLFLPRVLVLIFIHVHRVRPLVLDTPGDRYRGLEWIRSFTQQQKDAAKAYLAPLLGDRARYATATDQCDRSWSTATLPLPG